MYLDNSKKQYSNHQGNIEEIDIKALIFRALHFWPYILGSIFFGLVVAQVTNYFAKNVYQVNTTVQFIEQKNPFADIASPFTIDLKKVSEKTESNMVILKSFTHNKKVIKDLHLEVEYSRIGRINNQTLFNSAPFIIDWDLSHIQVTNEVFHIILNRNNTYSISLDAAETSNLYDYHLDQKHRISLKETSINKNISQGEWFESPYFKFRILDKPEPEDQFGNTGLETTKESRSEFGFQFKTYDQLVNKFRNNLSIKQITDEASIIELKLKGNNKTELVAYLNRSVEIFQKDQLNEKNLIAQNTIKFIDHEIQGVHDTLLIFQNELEIAQRENQLIDLSSQANFIYERFATIDETQSAMQSQLEYFHYLETNLNSRTNDFSNVIPPSMVGIDHPSLINGVQDLVRLSMEKSKLIHDLKPTNPVLINLDLQIDNAHTILLNNLHNVILVTELKIENQEKNKLKLQSEFETLPSAEQTILNIKRKHNVIDAQYTFLMERRSEAGIIMAANTSNNKVIDIARNSGQAPISPKRQLNYVIGLLIGLVLPIGTIFVKDFFQNKIYSIQDIQKLIDVPVIGVIGHVDNPRIESIQANPTSIISESFRSLRSNCEAAINDSIKKYSTAYDKNNGFVILITSLVEGEGKSINSLNLGLSYANGGKKTIIITADLRKPSLHKMLQIKDSPGLSNFLLDESSLGDIIQPTSINNLDYIGSGPRPNNPGELMLKSNMEDLVKKLKKTYDFIIIDTAPIGLVSDAKYLMKYSDINLHIVRQGYTKINLLESLSELYQTDVLKNYHIVMNDVDANSSNHNYGMAFSYGYSYAEKHISKEHQS